MLKVDFKKIPNSFGVYLFKDNSGQVLYVGKAINLQKRIKNHLEGKSGVQRINSLLNQAETISHLETGSEIEALLLEARLIKQYLPKYNIQLKDSKRYLYLGISQEEYPRVFFLRRPEKEKAKLTYFGPFPSSQSLKEILRLIRHIFPYRTCRALPHKLCLYGHLGLCPIPCEGKISKTEYRKLIKRLHLFLNGQITSLKRQLVKEMNRLAQELCYEEAGKIKRQINQLDYLLGHFKKFPDSLKARKKLQWLRKTIINYQGIDPFLLQRIEAYDISNLGKQIIVGAMSVLINGEAETSQYRQFKINLPYQDDPKAIYQILLRRLGHQEWVYPQLILIDGGKTQLQAAFEALKEHHLGGQVALLGLTKEKETIIVPQLGQEKIEGYREIKQSSRTIGLTILQLARDEAHRFAQRYYKKKHSQLTFPSEPKQKPKDQDNAKKGKKKKLRK